MEGFESQISEKAGKFLIIQLHEMKRKLMEMPFAEAGWFRINEENVERNFSKFHTQRLQLIGNIDTLQTYFAREL